MHARVRTEASSAGAVAVTAPIALACKMNRAANIKAASTDARNTGICSPLGPCRPVGPAVPPDAREGAPRGGVPAHLRSRHAARVIRGIGGGRRRFLAVEHDADQALLRQHLERFVHEP